MERKNKKKNEKLIYEIEGRIEKEERKKRQRNGNNKGNIREIFGTNLSLTVS